MAVNLRPYQERVVQEIGDANAIVKMPTGSGKTVVAAELISQALRRQGTSETVSEQTFCLFLVPARDLVAQQADTISWCTCSKTAQYKGGEKIPCDDFQVIVSTPEAFISLQSKIKRLHWKHMCICVFDEVHHVLKDHPYRKIALCLNDWSKKSGQQVQVVGLSASLTYDVADEAIEATLDRLSRELAVEKMISPSDEELLEGGYIPQNGKVQLQPVSFVPSGALPVEERKPHSMHITFFGRVERREATSFATRIYDAVISLEEYARSLCPDGYESPLCNEKLADWEDYAHRHWSFTHQSVELRLVFKRLEIWYVALRMIVQSWEEEQALVSEWLLMNKGHEAPESFPPPLAAAMLAVKQATSDEYIFKKLDHLCNHIQTNKDAFGERFRCILFVQQRITAHIIAQYINTKPDLQESEIKAGYVTARKSKITPSIKMTPTTATDMLDSFRRGDMNLLVATSVVEEGLDVSGANVIISYNHLKDSVELCQRFGRAREHESVRILMAERRDRPLELLEKVRQRQDQIVHSFEPHGTSQPLVQGGAHSGSERQMKQGRSARKLLIDPRIAHSPLVVLNEYKQKTEAVLLDIIRQEGLQFFCETTYKRRAQSVSATGTGPSKSKAKNLAATEVIKKLQLQNDENE